MDKQQEIRLAKMVGLTYIGDDESGEPEYLGDRVQFDAFEKMKDIYYLSTN